MTSLLQNPPIKAYLDRIDALSLRERGILFIAILGVLIFVSVNLLFQPLWDEQKRLEAEVTAKQDQVRLHQVQIEQMVAEQGRDPDAVLRKRRAELKENLRQTESSLADMTRGVVSPREMARLVRDMLGRNHSLQVLRVENLAPELLSDGAPPRVGADGTDLTPAPRGGLYRHGMRIELRGQYPDIVRYLYSLESMPAKLFWGEVDLKSETYPMSRVSLLVYTLSIDSAWIGM